MTKSRFIEPTESTADVVGRIAMAVIAVTAMGASWLSAQTIMRDPGNSAWLELWRTPGLMMFSALFAIVALRPRSSPGLWELAIFHKVAVSAITPFSHDPEAHAGGLIDSALAAVILVAYVLTKGWRGWGVASATPIHKPNRSTL